SSLPGIGAKRFYDLIRRFETAENVFMSSEAELKSYGLIGDEIAKLITNNRNIEKIDKYLKKVKDNGINVYLSKQEEYPANLKQIYDPPPVLYSLGELLETDSLAVAMVGSRKATEYGLKAAERLAGDLAACGVTVVSGMALGIDAAAHRGALKSKGRTIAVLGSGVTHVHPRSNLNIYNEIIKSGAVVSEYPLGMTPQPGNFPARNRIISGLSLGTVVVEAGLRSGSLITADLALEQGREVFAVPGGINSPNSAGTNSLIKNGAKLVSSVEDILEELNVTIECPSKVLEGYSLDETEALIADCLAEGGRSIDGIASRTGLEVSIVLSKVSIMELKGIISNINGIYYSEIAN
ncbi:MAG: protecting protein DprA, partial [Clostridia bacterium]|nr:protecting protein DprA [Clostridia bacterium]